VSHNEVKANGDIETTRGVDENINCDEDVCHDDVRVSFFVRGANFGKSANSHFENSELKLQVGERVLVLCTVKMLSNRPGDCNFFTVIIIIIITTM
jgi:hypothetical protein